MSRRVPFYVLVGLLCACSAESVVQDGGGDPDVAAVFDTDVQVPDDSGSGRDSEAGCMPPNVTSLTNCVLRGAECDALQSDLCDDGDPCTVDVCASGSQCDHLPRTCTDDNACTADTCEAGIGCVYAALDCDDDNACTVDECDPLDGCITSPLTCLESDLCTLAFCDPSTGCAHSPVGCDDGVACTQDSCDVSLGCLHQPIVEFCADGNPCLLWQCDQVAGCVFQELSRACDDGDYCTETGACERGTCSAGREVACEDGNSCTIDTCAADSGCVHKAVECDDGNPCSKDRCEPERGCVHETDGCDDADACTQDTCSDVTGCVHTAVSCKDDDPCTIEICDAAIGCRYDSVCDDGDACTEDQCDASGLCSYVELSCEDGSVCTSDACDTELGCTFAFAFPGCNDTSGFTVTHCHPLLGCLPTLLGCWTEDPCLEPDPEGPGACSFKPRKCSDDNPCTLDACEPGEGCVHFDYNPCIDGNTATSDLCDWNQGCVNNLLGEPICELTGSEGDEVLCSVELVKPDDADAAIPTKFAASLQLHIHWNNLQLEFLRLEHDLVLPTGEVVPVSVPPSPLSTGHTVFTMPSLFEDAAAAGTIDVGIVHFTMPSTALNAATISEDGETVDGNPELFRARFRLLADVGDVQPAEVRVSDVVGADENAFSIPFYVDGFRITQQRFCTSDEECDDDDGCTIDFCLVNGDHYCAHAPLKPDDVGIFEPDPCLVYTCDSETGTYVTTPDVCDDGNACTVDQCSLGLCQSSVIDPDDGDACTADFCDPNEGVFHLPAYCNDLNACTFDQCVPGLGCVNTPKDCDDGALCTTDACVNGFCKLTPHHELCDDGDPASQDFCAPELPESGDDGCLIVTP